MRLVFFYVAVYVMSFIKCEIRKSSSMTPFQSWYWNQSYTDKWNLKRKHLDEKKLEDNFEENANNHFQKSSTEELNDLSDIKKNFYEGINKLKNIYLECQDRVNRRLNKLSKVKVKSRLLELKNYVSSVYQCVKVFGFRHLDEMLEDDVIPLTDYVYFVKDDVLTNNNTDYSSGRSEPALRHLPLKEFATHVMQRGWTTLAYDRLRELLNTHSLKFRFSNSLVSQGRGRRRDHRMFAMMVMGFMIMASILIPMGFQFLTVLGGKSLLLAKLALIMSAITGLKKIATSNVGYGFYAGDGHHHDHIHHGFHDKAYQNYNGQGYK